MVVEVVEMEVVTADGKFRTINGESTGDDADLFWAMRGVSHSSCSMRSISN